MANNFKDILENNVAEEFFYRSGVFYEKLKKAVKSSDVIYLRGRGNIRETKDSVCFTLTALMGTGGNNVPIVSTDGGVRKLTPRECSRLQGFPDNFIIPNNLAKTHVYKQFGNSVTVSVVEKIARNILQVLNGGD